MVCGAEVRISGGMVPADNKPKGKTMKKLLVWLVKRFITKDALKAAIHAANKRIAEKPASERTQQVMAYGEDAAALTAEEIARNSAIDKARFNLPDAA